MTIADIQEDVASYIEACSFHTEPSKSDYIEIARRCLKSHEPKKALSYIEKIAQDSDNFFSRDLYEIRVKALEMLGGKEQVKALKMQEFKKRLSGDLYDDLVEREENKQAFKLEAIKLAFSFEDPHSSLEFLVHIKELKEAARYVRMHIHRLYGSLYQILRPIAKKLHRVDPIASSLLYRVLTDSVANEAVSKYYPYAAKDLATCEILSKGIIDWENVDSHDQYFSCFQQKHRRKTRFWTEFATAQEKMQKKKN